MSNPITPPPRFEIRKLEPQHLEWAKAILCHSNVFHSPVWAKIYPENQTERFYQGFKSATYAVQHQIDSGLSYGVFDREYVFKNHESAKTGGAIYFEGEEQRDMSLTGDDILERMDFPLASIALAYDAANPLDMEGVAPLFEALPDFPTFTAQLAARDKRDKTTLEVKGPGEVLKRMGTATRADYMNVKITKMMAYWLMFDAAEKGYRGIEIACYHDAMHHVWMHPPSPFRPELVAVFGVDEYEVEEDGKLVKPYGHVVQRLSKIYVYLK